jgi:hypothetical protein
VNDLTRNNQVQHNSANTGSFASSEAASDITRNIQGQAFQNNSSNVNFVIPPMVIAIPNQSSSAVFVPAAILHETNKRKIDQISSKSRSRRTCKAYRVDPDGSVFICGRTSDICKGSTRAGVCTFESVKESHYSTKVDEIPRSKAKQ